MARGARSSAVGSTSGTTPSQRTTTRRTRRAGAAEGRRSRAPRRQRMNSRCGRGRRQEKAQVAICGQPNTCHTFAFPNMFGVRAELHTRKCGVVRSVDTLRAREMSAMKKLVVLTIVAMLAASSPGCQSRRFCPWRNAATPAAPSITYDGMAASPPTYREPGMAAPSLAPSRGCGPGCSSCGGNSPQVLSGPQAFAPGPNTGPVLGQ